LRSEFENAARDVEQTIHKEVSEHTQALNEALGGSNGSASSGGSDTGYVPSWDAAHKTHNGRKSWRVKQGARPLWFKRQQNTRMWVQSGAARVKRHRPASGRNRSFFE
jgi:sec-independent protein translocase protein TatB